MSEAKENQAAASAALADCANSIWSASLALFLVAAGDSEFGSAVRSFLTSYFPDCRRTLSCFLEVSPSEKDPPISHVTLFPSIAVPLLAAFAATDFRSVMILVPRQTGRQEDRQTGSFEISADFISPIICKANAFLAWDHDAPSLES